MESGHRHHRSLIRYQHFPLAFFISCNLLFHFIFFHLQDEMVVAFRDIRPAAFRHYLVIPVKHIPRVKHLYRSTEDHQFVNHMLNVGKILLERDAPQSSYRFGFHQLPFYSVDHLHLHCLTLPFMLSWKRMKYSSAGPFGFLEVHKLLAKLRPVLESSSQA